MKAYIKAKIVEAQRRPVSSALTPVHSGFDPNEFLAGKSYSVADVRAMYNNTVSAVWVRRYIFQGTPGVFPAGRGYRITETALKMRMDHLSREAAA
jgi:hypothetical protein